MKKIILIIVFLLFIICIGGLLYYYYNNNFILQNNIKQAKITNIDKETICEKDADCLPEDPLIGILYLCKDKKCVEKFLNSPASNNCQEKGGKIEIRLNAKDIEYRVCVFSDQSECEEWKFFHQECLPGDFNPKDDIWEGEIIKSRNIEDNYYFRMLNGSEVKIGATDNQIRDLLSSLEDKKKIIKLKGIMSNSFDSSGYKKLNVEQIVNLNDIVFKQIDEKTSFEKAKKAIQKDDKFVEEGGDNLELINTQTLKCPYCWIFDFYYFDKEKNKKKVEVKMQEGEVKKISYIKESEILYDCEEFSMVKVCTEQYDPVCAKLEKILPKRDNNKLNSNSDYKIIEWKTFSNPCKACIYKSKVDKIVGYKNGECENI
ncbi:MAG: DUF333 domain-containing protein [Xanthomonadaceae bacterium]|nr:DUF333 domain-containing protein [Rhodospirillaceae bacterium]NIA17874.1 DUF333 domain-containing protein [Xanthomonadaceae bacterium]